MNNFIITFLTDNKPNQYWTKADDGFDAECNFLQWASDSLSSPVRVVRVERIER